MVKDNPDVDEETECPECQSDHLIRDYERGELVCKACGLVLDDNFIDEGPEWRAFDAEQTEKRSRSGAPMTLMVHDKGLSTDIGWGNKDSYGKSVPSKNRAQLYRMRKWQHRTRVSNSTERNLALALNELNRLSSKIGLHRNVRETAASIYRRAVNSNLIRGRSVEGVAAAALYAACRQCNVPRTLDEIATVSPLHRRDIGRSYRFLAREMGLKIAPPGPADYISRFCSELELDPATEQEAQNLLKKAGQEELISGRGPTGFAGAAIYIATRVTGQRRSQKVIATVTGVTEVTIRNRYRELADLLGIEID